MRFPPTDLLRFSPVSLRSPQLPVLLRLLLRLVRLIHEVYFLY